MMSYFHDVINVMLYTFVQVMTLTFDIPLTMTFDQDWGPWLPWQPEGHSQRLGSDPDLQLTNNGQSIKNGEERNVCEI